MEFLGFVRENGVGIRNNVLVLCTVGCSSYVARRIVDLNPRAKLFAHHQGCCHVPSETRYLEKVLANIALNPNIYSVLLVSLGCESVSAERVADRIAGVKEVEVVRVLDKGVDKAVEEGSRIVERMIKDSMKVRRSGVDLSELKLAIKCGGSDFSSGIISNPVAGRVADMIVEGGGTVIFGETTEVIGAEHILMRRAVSRVAAEKLNSFVKGMEERVIATGVDMREGQPTPGNIRGGITTIEEKSLGAICKAGSSKLMAAVDYGDLVTEKGLVFMNTPGREPEALTGFAAAGAQLILFTTGLGVPQGHPISPVLKISGNPETCKRLSKHIDFDLSPVFYGKESIDEAAKKLLKKIIKVASGEATRSELIGYEDPVEIYITGPII
ncbi:MAG: galactonate dehydratase [Thaumarchaeota archaeon]|nr:MAG: galactonate dehydratase [Nitrososphaerota archaeon]